MLLMHFFSEKAQHTVMLAVSINYHANLLAHWVDTLNECWNKFKINCVLKQGRLVHNYVQKELHMSTGNFVCHLTSTCVFFPSIDSGNIWRTLRDLDNTPRLRHPWSKSHCQASLLSVLGIDANRTVIEQRSASMPV